MPLDQEFSDKAGATANAGIKQLRVDQGYMPMTAHLGELRNRIIRCVAYIAAFALISYFFYDHVWNFIIGPIDNLMAKSVALKLQQILPVTTRLGDNWSILITVLLLSGFILSFPLILFELWRFITPALSAKIRSWGSGVILASVILFWCGIFFARIITFKTVTEFLAFQLVSPPIGNIQPPTYLNIPDYLSFFTGFHIAFGLSFQLPIASVILGSLGIISSRFFFRFWRHATVALCLFAIVIMPPDVYAMLSLMIPMMGLYFLSALLVRLIEKRKA